MQIILKDILLFGYHGVHPLENEVGTNFKIDLLIDMVDKKIVDLHDTIDYAEVFNILKKEFDVTEKLLEVLADRILNAIFSKFQHILQIEIQIMKVDPPIPSFQGMVGVKKIKRK
jgi:dihydroneopterin aldolase